MKDGEKQAWLRALRSDQPLNRELRDELADMLERFFYPKGRPPLSGWDYANNQLRAVGYGIQIQDEIDRMKDAGERPKGGRRDIAVKIVAERHGLTTDALEKRLKPRKPKIISDK